MNITMKIHELDGESNHAEDPERSKIPKSWFVDVPKLQCPDPNGHFLGSPSQDVFVSSNQEQGWDFIAQMKSHSTNTKSVRHLPFFYRFSYHQRKTNNEQINSAHFQLPAFGTFGPDFVVLVVFDVTWGTVTPASRLGEFWSFIVEFNHF